MLQLKADALERFEAIGALYQKMHNALVKKGSQDKTYLKTQQAISAELMNIRFTARITERLCDSVRSMVEQARSHERKIQDLCVNKAHMPRPHFIKVFPGNETNMEWLKAEITSGKAYASALMRAAPAIIAMADSSESQLRSGILSSAIFRTCAFEIEPTLLRFG